MAGASLVQLYTGMVYRGPKIIKKIKEEIIFQLKNDGVKNYSELIGQGSLTDIWKKRKKFNKIKS